MKLQADPTQAEFTISAHGPGYVEVNRVRYEHGLCVGAELAPEGWGEQGFAALTERDFQRLVELRPELVLIGTGERQRFASPALLRHLIAAGIGFEVMTTAAACRTYNILVGEGRKALAALLIDPVTDSTDDL